MAAQTVIPRVYKKFETEFKFKEGAGSGFSGKVNKCQKGTDETALRAIKVIAIKDRTHLEVLKNEIEMLEALKTKMRDNPRLAKFVLNYEESWIEEFKPGDPIPFITRKSDSGQFLLICTEYLNGNDGKRTKNLNEYLKEKTQENHSDIVNNGKRFFTHVTQGLLCLHDLDILHRDLNPLNVCLTKDHDGTTVAKIIDFGTSRFLQHATCYDKGNVSYRSPEIKTSDENLPYGTKTDIWSLGMIFYCIVIPKSPNIPSWNYNNLVKQFSNRLSANDYDVDATIDFDISETDRAVLKSMLKGDPNQRISAERLYQVIRPWENNTSDVEAEIDTAVLQ